MMRLCSDLVSALRARLRGGRRAPAMLIAAFALPAVLALVLVTALAPALDAQARIPVAVVNLDEGVAGSGGSTVNSGAELVDSLSDSAELAWDAVDEETALDGLSDGTYALVLEIPEDYSEKVASLDGADPSRAQLEIISTGSENVLATQAGSAALKQVQTRLRADLGESYLLRVLNDVNGQASSLTLTADGAVMLDAAYDALEQGTGAIAEGLEQTAAGTEALASGVDAIASGVSAAGTGAVAVSDAMDGVAATYGQLAPMANGVSAGLNGVYQGLSLLTGEVSESLDEAVAALGSLGELQGTLAEQVPALSGAAADMVAGEEVLSTSAQGVRDGVDSARAGVEAVGQQASDLQEAVAGSDGTGGLVGDVSELNEIAGSWLAGENEEQIEDKIIDLAEALQTEESQRTDAQQQLVDEFTADTQRYEALSEGIDDQASTVKQQAADATQAASDASQDLERVDASVGTFEEAAGTIQDAASRASASAGAVASSLQGTAGSVTRLQIALGTASLLTDKGVALEPGQDPVSLTSLVGQLAPTSALGQGVSALAASVSATPQAFSGFSSAVDQLGQGNLALGQALGTVGTGVSGLGDGLSALASVQSQLASGVGQLREGQQTINDTLSVAGDELGELASSRDERAEVAAAPVSLTTTSIDRVEGAASLVPAALAVVLWLGALAASYVLPGPDRRAVLAGRAVPSALSSIALTAAFCLVQGLVAAVVLVLVTGAPTDAPAFAALIVLGSLAFGSIACALRLLCGRFTAPVSLGILAIQLLSAGTILPAAFTGGVFSALGAVLPVPVLAEALRGAIAGSVTGLGAACAVLAIALAVGVAVSLAAVARWRAVRPERAFA